MVIARVSDVPYLRQRNDWEKESFQWLSEIRDYLKKVSGRGLPLPRLAFAEETVFLHRSWYNSLDGQRDRIPLKVSILENSEKNYLAQDRINIEYILARWDELVKPEDWAIIKRSIYRIINGATEYVIDKTISLDSNKLTVREIFERAFFVNDSLLRLNENSDCTSTLLKSILNRYV